MNRSQRVRKWQILLIAICGLVALDYKSSFASEGDDPSTIYKKIADLVQEYYNKATVSVTDKGVSFKFKTKKEAGFYSNEPLEVPATGGILGDVVVVSGEFKGKEKKFLPFEERCGFHTKLLMAPYSSKKQSHLLAWMRFPEDSPVEFKEKFKELINSYNAGEEPVVAAAPAKATIPNNQSSTDQTSSVLRDDVFDGACKDRRQALLKKLKEVEERGVGIAAYSAEFNRIEASVKAGTEESTIARKLDALSKLVSDQLDSRAQAAAQAVSSRAASGTQVDTRKQDKSSMVSTSLMEHDNPLAKPRSTSADAWCQVAVKAEIPGTPASGKLFGQPFVPDNVTYSCAQVAGSGCSVEFQRRPQGHTAFAPQEIHIWLKGSDKPDGKTFYAVPGTDNHTLHATWNPREEVKGLKSEFFSDYGMRIVFKQRDQRNRIPGYVMIRLPDRSYLQGYFYAREFGDR